MVTQKFLKHLGSHWSSVILGQTSHISAVLIYRITSISAASGRSESFKKRFTSPINGNPAVPIGSPWVSTKDLREDADMLNLLSLLYSPEEELQKELKLYAGPQTTCLRILSGKLASAWQSVGSNLSGQHQNRLTIDQGKF